jgi:sec-independent protein translocase protein TatA
MGRRTCNHGLRRLLSPTTELFARLLTRNRGAPMFEGLLQPTHLLIIAGIALLIFGPKKLPEFGKGLGEGIRGFKSAMKGEEETSALKAPIPTAPEEKV